MKPSTICERLQKHRYILTASATHCCEHLMIHITTERWQEAIVPPEDAIAMARKMLEVEARWSMEDFDELFPPPKPKPKKKRKAKRGAK